MKRLFCLLLLATITASPALAGKSAFVVGIDTYSQLKPEAQLQRPSADANAVGRTLETLGFAVTLLTRAVTQEDLLRRFSDFLARIEAGDTVLLYFAGHGIALDNTNYLLPSDIPALEAGQELLVRTRALAETDLRGAIRERGARVVVMVIDACRDNPFPQRGTRSVGLSRGLIASTPADGVFTLYSAALGQQALDRLPGDDPDPNSVFTRIFLKELARPGQNLIDLGESVRDAVSALAESARLKQVPAYYNEVRGARTIMLADTGPAPAAPAARREAPGIAALPLPAGPAIKAAPPTPAVATPAAPAFRPSAPEPVRAVSPPLQPAATYSYLTGLDRLGDNWLGLRTEPRTGATLLKKMGPETLMTVLRREGSWRYVELRTGESGWAYGDYIACCRAEPADSKPRAAPPPASAARVSPTASYSYLVGLDRGGDNWLALRSAPGGQGTRLMKMGPETLLTVLSQQGKWNYVRLRSGETGWAHGDYMACCRTSPGP